MTNPPPEQQPTAEQGIAYLVELTKCYIQSLPPPVRGPVEREAQVALDAINRGRLAAAMTGGDDHG